MLDIIRRRRSIRGYSEQEIPRDLIQDLQEAALRAPSSMNRQSWSFAFVTDREKLRELAYAKEAHGRFLEDAALGIVVCGDPGVSDCWIEDCSIAAAFMQLTATELGLGSCWIQIRDRRDVEGMPAEERVTEILGLPENLRTLCILAIGYPKAKVPGRDFESLPWDKVIEIP